MLYLFDLYLLSLSNYYLPALNILAISLPVLHILSPSAQCLIVKTIDERIFINVVYWSNISARFSLLQTYLHMYIQIGTKI